MVEAAPGDGGEAGTGRSWGRDRDWEGKRGREVEAGTGLQVRNWGVGKEAETAESGVREGLRREEAGGEDSRDGERERQARGRGKRGANGALWGRKIDRDGGKTAPWREDKNLLEGERQAGREVEEGGEGGNR